MIAIGNYISEEIEAVPLGYAIVIDEDGKTVIARYE